METWWRCYTSKPVEHRICKFASVALHFAPLCFQPIKEAVRKYNTQILSKI